jgi:hypothetical protein
MTTPLLVGAGCGRTACDESDGERHPASAPPGHPARGRFPDHGRSPGSRVVAAAWPSRRPAAPVTRLDSFSPLTVAGAAPAWPRRDAPGSLLAPDLDNPRNHERYILWRKPIGWSRKIFAIPRLDGDRRVGNDRLDGSLRGSKGNTVKPPSFWSWGRCRGCPRNCKRRAARQPCHWATGKAAQGKDPRARRPAIGRGHVRTHWAGCTDGDQEPALS